MNKKIKRMDIKEFRDTGILQEVNRQFLHPLGLALEVKIDEEGNETLGGIWDYRDDGGGIMFGEEEINNKKAWEKAKDVEKLKKSHEEAHKEIFGSVIQPIKIKERR